MNNAASPEPSSDAKRSCELAGAMDYAAVGQAVARFGKRLERDARLRQVAHRVETQMSNVET